MSSRKKILFLSNVYPNPIQPTKGVFNRVMVEALVRHHDVEVVSPIPWPTYCKAPSQFQAYPVAPGASGAVHYPVFYYTPGVLRARFGSFLWWSLRSLVKRLVSANRPDLVLAYWAHPDGEAGIRTARLAGVPCIVMVGGSDVLVLTSDHARRRAIQRVLQAADAVVVVSDDIGRKVIDLGTSADKIHVVHRGVNAELFFPRDPNIVRRRLGLPQDKHLLLWVGRMVSVKGLDILLRACAELKERIAFHLYLIGAGPLRSSLLADCRRQNLTDVVSFVGPVAHEQLPDWYGAADLTVLPSRSEGVPNVLRESLACGTPFVASNVGGIAEIARTDSCRLVPAEDPESLAHAIHEVCSAGRKSLTTSSAGISSLERATGKLLDVIEAACAPSSGRQAKPSRQCKAGVFRQLAKNVINRLTPSSWFLVKGPAQTDAVCLTFDDGPHPEHTPRLLELLDNLDVRATFFVVGNQAAKHPDIIRDIAQRGHDIGQHSFWHKEPDTVSARELMVENSRTAEVVTQLIGSAPVLFRPPRGKLSVTKLWHLWRRQQTVVLWSKDPRDYACQSPQELQDWFVDNPLAPGDIVLLHDNVAHAAQVLPEVVARTRQRGIGFAKISDWIEKEECR